MKNCPYNPLKVPPCLSLSVRKFSYLTDFLDDNSTGNSSDRMIAHSIDCCTYDGFLEIVESRCIGCMFCIVSCPGHLVSINNRLALDAKCSDMKLYEALIEGFTPEKLFFRGSIVELPRIRSMVKDLKYKSFEEFTRVKETEHISVWGAKIIEFLADEKARVALEVGVVMKDVDRGGRLDISVLSNHNLYVAEAKVSFSKMIDEDRYTSQLLNYDREISRQLKKYHDIEAFHMFLLIGGSELDLLPPNHSDCTSNVGNRSQHFYDNCAKYGFRFISANALLMLALMRIKFGEFYTLEKVSELLYSEGVYGILSCGLVKKVNDNFTVEEFSCH